jgi:hypothetical protein
MVKVRLCPASSGCDHSATPPTMAASITAPSSPVTVKPSYTTSSSCNGKPTCRTRSVAVLLVNV